MTTNTSALYFRKIPEDFGPPVIGYTLDFMKDPLEAFQRLERRNGLIVRARSIVSFILMLGPDANQFVLQDRDSNFSNYEGWKYFIDRVFPGAIMSMDGDAHRFQRKLMAVAFKKPSLEAFLAGMNPGIQSGVNKFSTGSHFKVFNNLKQLTLDLASNTFMGVPIGKEADDLNHAFIQAVDAATALIRYPVPPFQMWKGVKARAFLVDHFNKILPQKRAHNTPDFFSQFCHAETEEGGRFTDKEIVDHMIFLMMAAHDTTTSTMTTMFYALAKHPEWQERAREQSIALDKEFLEFDDLEKLTALEWSMKEALRMYPPLTSIPRGVAKDCEFNGYQLKKGDKVSVAPIHTHYMEQYWSNPYHFDPERFAPGRAEHKKNFFQFIPFGGGHHMCLGQHFADLQVKAIVHQILRKYRWSVSSDYTMPYQMVPIQKPHDGLPVKLERI